jgi:hypothetical protein
MPEPLPPYAKQWMQQWKSAAEHLPQIRARELRELTDEQATRFAIALAPLLPIPLRPSSGLVEMQKWFSKWKFRLDKNQ